MIHLAGDRTDLRLLCCHSNSTQLCQQPGPAPASIGGYFYEKLANPLIGFHALAPDKDV